MELYFFPEKPEDIPRAFAMGESKEEELYKLTDLIRKLREDLEESNLPKWEVSLKGYIEVSSGGVLPGGKTGFEATIRISSP
ncbi:MAG: hypothetical protein L6282_16380 [Candidatus Methanoperedenaceae archaeon]|nr:hypothetical protein [Candidatus Methanoperedenaceae archaeon]